jgi:hypothetical protein
MEQVRAVAMDATEIAEFLESQRTGVLSLARSDDAYGVPVSYAYDQDGSDVYFRLGYAEASLKREFVDAAEHVSFAVYAETEAGWKSVLAQGRLEEVAANSLDSQVAEAIQQLDIPFVTIFDRPASKLEFRLTRLSLDRLTGRKEVAAAP